MAIYNDAILIVFVPSESVGHVISYECQKIQENLNDFDDDFLWPNWVSF